jgi:hypothetical protein
VHHFSDSLDEVADMTSPVRSRRIPTGPAAAALLASGIGILVIGLMTTGAVLSGQLKNVLSWYDPAGPLTGKTGVGVLVWLISWAALHHRLAEKDLALQRVFAWTRVLIALGLILVFPPVFEALE